MKLALVILLWSAALAYVLWLVRHYLPIWLSEAWDATLNFIHGLIDFWRIVFGFDYDRSRIDGPWVFAVVFCWCMIGFTILRFLPATFRWALN